MKQPSHGIPAALSAGFLAPNLESYHHLNLMSILRMLGVKPPLSLEGDSGGICNTLGNDSMCDSKQRSSYELFCLESHILSFPKVLQIPPESPYMYLWLGFN